MYDLWKLPNSWPLRGTKANRRVCRVLLVRGGILSHFRPLFKVLHAMERMNTTKRSAVVGNLQVYSGSLYHKYKADAVVCSCAVPARAQKLSRLPRMQYQTVQLELDYCEKHLYIACPDDSWEGLSSRLVVGCRSTELQLSTLYCSSLRIRLSGTRRRSMRTVRNIVIWIGF